MKKEDSDYIKADLFVEVVALVTNVFFYMDKYLLVLPLVFNIVLTSSCFLTYSKKINLEKSYFKFILAINLSMLVLFFYYSYTNFTKGQLIYFIFNYAANVLCLFLIYLNKQWFVRDYAIF